MRAIILTLMHSDASMQRIAVDIRRYARNYSSENYGAYFDPIDLGNRRSKGMILFIEDGRHEPGTVGSHECDYDCPSYLGRLRNS